jgi:hypothetical protein
MKRSMRLNLVAGGLAGILLGAVFASPVFASDSLVVTITPRAEYAVDIDTNGVTMDFLSMMLDADGFVVRPATVTIQSTFAYTDLRLDAFSSAGTGGTPWTLGSSNALDTAQVWALFTSTTVMSIPAKGGDYFDDVNDRVTNGNQQAGDTVRFEDGVFDVDSQFAGTKSHFWLRFHVPASVSDNHPKYISLTLTAEQPD